MRGRTAVERLGGDIPLVVDTGHGIHNDLTLAHQGGG